MVTELPTGSVLGTFSCIIDELVDDDNGASDVSADTRSRLPCLTLYSGLPPTTSTPVARVVWPEIWWLVRLALSPWDVPDRLCYSSPISIVTKSPTLALQHSDPALDWYESTARRSIEPSGIPYAGSRHRCSAVDCSTPLRLNSYRLSSQSISSLDTLLSVSKTKCKAYSSGDSHVVTHRTTNPTVHSLSTGERTGSSVLCDLWPYVTVRVTKPQIYPRPRRKREVNNHAADTGPRLGWLANARAWGSVGTGTNPHKPR